MPLSALDRFNDKYFVAPDTCWIWVAGLYKSGYGSFLDGTRTSRAHRFSYETFKGPISDGLVLDHLCRKICCVNPDHLEPVTQKENILRSPRIKAARERRGKLLKDKKPTPNEMYVKNNMQYYI